MHRVEAREFIRLEVLGVREEDKDSIINLVEVQLVP